MLSVTMSKPVIPSGTLIDSRYLIQKVLGQGGLGRTYLASDTRRFNEACVLKEFAPSGSGKHSLQKSRSLFKREAEILYHVQHSQIPDFLACFEDDGRLFLVQEYVNGTTYSDLLKSRRKQNSVFSEQEVIDWLNHLLPVLDYIHQCGIIHRDISPDNIMLPINSRLPVLIDFGVGKQIVDSTQLGNDDEDVEEISYVGKMSLVGKVGYAPHEQIRLGVCSPSSDLYALGVTAVVLLTCKDPSALMNQYSLKWEWRNRTDVSLAFGQIIDKMLADTPVNRYQTAPEVSRDLAALINTAASAPSLIDGSAETLSGDLDWPETTLKPPITLQTMISPAPSPAPSPLPPSPPGLSDTAVSPQSQSPQSQSPLAQTHSLSPVFIEQCQKKLAEFIGPMAAFVIDEAIALHQPDSPAALVDALLPEIPSSEEAIAFRAQLLS
ncbi:MAG: serine/threonine-protein kinase [Phormidesmis sp.]